MYVNVKVRFAVIQAKNAQRWIRGIYNSYLSLTSALEGVGGLRHVAAALPPRKTRYPMCRRLGGPQSQTGRVRKNLPPPGFDPRTVQPVASLYTDCPMCVCVCVCIHTHTHTKLTGPSGVLPISRMRGSIPPPPYVYYLVPD